MKSFIAQAGSISALAQSTFLTLKSMTPPNQQKCCQQNKLADNENRLRPMMRKKFRQIRQSHYFNLILLQIR